MEVWGTAVGEGGVGPTEVMVDQEVRAVEVGRNCSTGPDWSVCVVVGVFAELREVR